MGLTTEWRSNRAQIQLHNKNFARRLSELKLIMFLLTEAERGRHTNFLAIDYSKTFDKVDINVALRKLLDLHFRPELLEWLSNLLSNRQQCVRLGQTTSDWTGTTCGVPQGTKVGPVVFLAMVDNVAHASPFHRKYVDNITIGESRPNKAPVPLSTLPQPMNGIRTQASGNHMTLSINECALLQVQFWQRPTTFTAHFCRWTACDHRHQHDFSGYNLAPFSQIGHRQFRDDHERQHQEVLSCHPKTCWNHHQTLTQVLRDIHLAKSWVCCPRVTLQHTSDPLRQYPTGPACLTAYHLPWAKLWACLEQNWTS